MNDPLRSVHTTTFPDILKQLGISLLISTYQAGKVIVVRADGEHLNTHFRVYQKPMGLAVAPGRIAIGSAHTIWELRDVPAVGAKMQPVHDACFIPRMSFLTGDIDIHELAYGQEGLWFLNTRFSCLCTLDGDHSFVPRWRPAFISGYDLGDRCHLNGLGMLQGIPKSVTALAETDTPGGWRIHKAAGGILMDVPSQEIWLRGLSMPHSPRWYGNRLWVLESGQGSLAVVDPEQGRWQTVAQMPGFTRGLDFAGDLAFIGLSKIRETAVFSGLPITQRLTERICGVWVVNIQTGKTVAFLRFEEGVQEIFAVQVLSGIRFPEMLGDPRFADPEQEQILASTYVLPDQALGEISQRAAVSVFRVEGDPEPAVTHFAVIAVVQQWQGASETLLSVETSIREGLAAYIHREQITWDIVVVDDGSRDGTWEQLQVWAAGQDHVRLVRHTTPQGEGAARNTGVAATRAQGLFFITGGERFLGSHILAGLQLLNRPLDPQVSQPIFPLPKSYPAAVKTGILVETAHEDDEFLRQALPVNVCLRREVYEFIGGFAPNLPTVGDPAFTHWLTHFFAVIWLPQATVVVKGEWPAAIPAQAEQVQTVIAARLAQLEAKFDLDYNPDRLFALGSAAHDQGNLEQAAAYFQRCLELNPDFHLARYNLGVTCGDLERWAEAEFHLQIAVQTEPRNPKIYNSLGFLHSQQNHLKEAIHYYRQALIWDPEFADAHMNLGMTLLKMGHLEEGWKAFEWRWQTRQFTPFQCPHPRWQGEPIDDKILLVHTEQGSGDSIQFARFLPLAAQRCQKLLLVAPQPLIRLLSTIPGVAKVYPGGDIPVDAFQVYVPLMSLPHCLGIRDLEAIPAQVPYLTPAPLPAPLVLSRLNGIAQKKRPQVGVCWAGSPTQGNDRHRSTQLALWKPLLSLPGIAFHSLQKGPPVAQLADLPDYLSIHNWDPYLHDFADTAAVIQQLDLVITVDTSVAHLAGALGTPTWTLLCYNCDWRWLLDRSDSPYYPTMKLYRQPQPKNWDPVIKQITLDLRELQTLLC